MLRRNGIRGNWGETFALDGLGVLGSKRVLLIGADRGDEVAAIRETGMRAGSAARPYRIVATTVVTLGDDASTAAAAFVEGFLLVSYCGSTTEKIGATPSPRGRRA